MQCIYKKDVNNKFYGCLGMCFISHISWNYAHIPPVCLALLINLIYHQPARDSR